MPGLWKVGRLIYRRLLIAAALLLAATAAISREAPTSPSTTNSTIDIADSKKVAEPSHGELLYENYCTGCHTSVAHRRDNRRAKSVADVNVWVRRWANELKLDWSSEDIDDVTSHLVHRYYKFESKQGQLSGEESVTAPPAQSEIAPSIGCPE
jgi:cytochrome c5